MKKSKKILKILLVIFFLMFFVISQVYAQVRDDPKSWTALDIKEEYAKDPSIVDRLSEEEMEWWRTELSAQINLNNTTILNDPFKYMQHDSANDDNKYMQEIIRKVDARQKGIAEEEEQKEYDSKTDEEKEEYIEKYKGYTYKEIEKYFQDDGNVTPASEEVKEAWRNTINKAYEDGKIAEDQKILDLAHIDGKTADEINELLLQYQHRDDTIYQYPDKEDSTRASSLDDMIGDADSFLASSTDAAFSESSLQGLSQSLYNILLAIGVVVAVIVGSILGIRFMISGAEDKADVKELLIPYIVGCVVVFGAFAIWKIVVTVISGI